MFAGSNGLDPTAFPSLLKMENDLVALAGDLLDAPDGVRRLGHLGWYPSRSCSPCWPPARAATTRPRAWCCPPRRTRRSTRPRPTSGCGPCSSTSTRSPCGPTRPPWRRPSTTPPCSSSPRPRPMRTASSTPSPRSRRWRRRAASAVTSTPASAGGCCRTSTLATPWTFAVEGVTSVSVDLHKYAYTPKGVSVLLHRTAALRSTHLFASATWPGYTMLNATMQSTRSGGPLAAAWGRDPAGSGSTATPSSPGGRARRRSRSRRPRTASPVCGCSSPPDSTLLALATDDSCDAFTVADEMLERGWYVQPQLSFGDLPPTLHLTPLGSDGARGRRVGRRSLGCRRIGSRGRPGSRGPRLWLRCSAAWTRRPWTTLALPASSGRRASRARTARWRCRRGWPVSTRCSTPARPALREALLLGVLDRLSRPTPG
jgi:sphinganine-1-phosphate aldolase